MGINDKLKAYNGLVNWLRNDDLLLNLEKNGRSFRKQDEALNTILIDFGKAEGIKMEPDNSPNYRGSYQPVVSNAVTVQENWDAFVHYINTRYSKTVKKAEVMGLFMDYDHTDETGAAYLPYGSWDEVAEKIVTKFFIDET